MDAKFAIPGEKKQLIAKFYGDENGKRTIGSREELDKILKDLAQETYQVLVEKPCAWHSSSMRELISKDREP